MNSKIIKIVSGGQTGADRGGLDAAIELRVTHGGWCPKGRLSEDGSIPLKYNQKENTNKNYLKRTEKNVVDSSSTIILTVGKLKGGSKRTADFAEQYKRPCLVIDVNNNRKEIISEIVEWLENLHDSEIVLNVAGSRGSKAPNLQKDVKEILIAVLSKINKIDLLKEDEVIYKETKYYNFADIKPDAYKRFLPLVGKLTANPNTTAGFDMENMDVDIADIPWFKVETYLCKEKRFIVQVVGDSMEPTINKYDYVVCEYHRRPYNSKVVIMQPGTSTFIDGECAVKRISQDKDNWIFASDNKKYDDKMIPKDFSNAYPIIGEVIYNLTKQERVR
ncbi:MAG: putative molybdenum carrier protein [Verrucomicrobiota bacterium]|nr:putative molybdenum carrier protein [Verrucomicrobiota bacterium]